MEKSARTSPNNVRNKRAMFEGNVSGESSPKSTRTPRKDTCREGTRGRNKSAPPVNRRRDSDYNPVYNQSDILKEYGPSAVWLLTGGYKNSGKNGMENGNNAADDNKSSGKTVAEDTKKIGKPTTDTLKSKVINPNTALLSTDAPKKNRNRVINHHITQTTSTYKNNNKTPESTYLPPLPKSPPPSSPTFPNMLLSPPPLPPKFTNHISPPASLLSSTSQPFISPPASLLSSTPSSPVSPGTQSVLSKTCSLPFKVEVSEKYVAERIERRSRAYKSTRTDGRNQQHDMDDNVDGNSSRDKKSVMQHLRNIFGEKVACTQPIQPIQPLKQRSKSVTRDSGAKQHAKAFATDISKETYLFSRNPSGKNQVPTWETTQKFEKVYSTHENNPKSPQVHRSQIVIELDAHDKPVEVNKAARKTSYPVKNKTKPQIDQCKENFTTAQPRNEARNVQERSIPITIQQSTRTDDKLPQFPLADCTKQQAGLHTNRQSTVPFLQSNHQAPQHNHTVHQYLVGSKQQLKRSMMDEANKEVELGTGEKTLAASPDAESNSQFQGKLIKSDKGPSECLIKCALCRNRQIS